MSFLPLEDVARTIGLTPSDLVPYGRGRAKLALEVLTRSEPRPARTVLVTSVTPVGPQGEGKTVTAIGLAMAMARLGRRAVCVLREPALGASLGGKGSGAGGGAARLDRGADLDFGLTGDTHAVAVAHNLLAAMVDASDESRIVPESVTWRRVSEINDRGLRRVRTGLDRAGAGRDTAFESVGVSEVMAVLALARDRADLRRRLGAIVVGEDRARQPVTAEDLGVAGAMAVLLRDAFAPNLVQTCEGTAAFVHAGVYADGAHGGSSIVADRIARRCADFVVTEAGGSAEVGAEKFFNLKCRASGVRPAAAVLVCTVRSAAAFGETDLARQIGVLRLHGVPVVAAIQRLAGDRDREVEQLRDRARAAGAHAAESSTVWQEGGRGGEALARAVVAACAEPSTFRFLYPEEAAPIDKIATIVERVYGASSVEYTPLARRRLDTWVERGWGHLPVCVARSSVPRGGVVTVRDVRAAVGAGYLVAEVDEIALPGLGSALGARRLDVDAAGEPTGWEAP